MKITSSIHKNKTPVTDIDNVESVQIDEYIKALADMVKSNLEGNGYEVNVSYDGDYLQIDVLESNEVISTLIQDITEITPDWKDLESDAEALETVTLEKLEEEY